MRDARRISSDEMGARRSPPTAVAVAEETAVAVAEESSGDSHCSAFSSGKLAVALLCSHIEANSGTRESKQVVTKCGGMVANKRTIVTS